MEIDRSVEISLRMGMAAVGFIRNYSIAIISSIKLLKIILDAYINMRTKLLILG